MAATAISFINIKGGVGKTACVVNIGAILAKKHKKKVLIVDLDPQSSSSLWLLNPKQYIKHTQNNCLSVKILFDDRINGNHNFQFDKIAIKGVPISLEGNPHIPNLHLLPASPRLFITEDEIYRNKESLYFEYLYLGLQPYYNKYDYILFDCPPNMYSITKNAIFASEHCIVPSVPDFLSLAGIKILANLLRDFTSSVNTEYSGRPVTTISAAIISHYRSNVIDQGTQIGELKSKFLQLKDKRLISPNAPVLEPSIRLCAAVAASTSEHLPVILHKPRANGAIDYQKLTADFLKYF
ncbi:MAG: ParA family protein [Gammaproteobacteria bacterium]|nr:ParA family protein [Gammaproteobacteria bacterium]